MADSQFDDTSCELLAELHDYHGGDWNDETQCEEYNATDVANVSGALREAHARGKREGMIEALRWVCVTYSEEFHPEAFERLAELEKEETGE